MQGERHAITTEILDPIDAGPGLVAFSREALSDSARGVIEAIEGATALSSAARCSRLLSWIVRQHVFDLIEPGALKNRPVLLTALGGGLRHSLVVEHQLRPLFGFFEACTVSTAIYASATEFEAGQPLSAIIAARLANAVDQFAGHLKAPLRGCGMTRRRSRSTFRFVQLETLPMTTSRTRVRSCRVYLLRIRHQWSQDGCPIDRQRTRAGVSARHRHVHWFRGGGARLGRAPRC